AVVHNDKIFEGVRVQRGLQLCDSSQKLPLQETWLTESNAILHGFDRRLESTDDDLGARYRASKPLTLGIVVERFGNQESRDARCGVIAPQSRQIAILQFVVRWDREPAERQAVQVDRRMMNVGGRQQIG